MKFVRLPVCAAFFATLLLSSCAQKFTAAQRAELSTVRVAPTEVDPDGYEEPHGGDIRARNGATSLASPTGGAIGPLVGWAVGSAIAGTQNANFKGKNSGHFSNVAKNTPTDLGPQLTAALRKDLKTVPFFKNRVAETSGNVVSSKINSYRLVRREKDEQGELKFSPEIFIEVYLKNAAGKTLAGRSYVAAGAESYPISEYSAKPALSRRVYSESLEQVSKQFIEELERKSAE